MGFLAQQKGWNVLYRTVDSAALGHPKTTCKDRGPGIIWGRTYDQLIFKQRIKAYKSNNTWIKWQKSISLKSSGVGNDFD